MTSSDSENTNNKVARFKPSRKFYVFLISLVLASGFWLLNALNKTYVEGVNIAIKYINLPSNRAFSPVPPSSITIELSGDGYSLMQLMDQAEEDTVIIDLEQLEFKSQGSRKSVHIPTSVIIDDLRRSVSNGVNVSRVNRDTIVIITERGETIGLNVKPNIFVSLEQGFVLVRPVYSVPEIVNVKGPVSILENTQEIETEHISLEQLSESTELEVSLACDSRFLQTEFKTVKLVAEIEPLTEGEIFVPIQIQGLPEGKRVRLIPNTITIKYTTGLSHYDFISPDLFSATINYEDVILKPSKLEVKILSSPGVS